MRKIIVFSILLALPATVFGTDFAQSFFDTHLNARVNRFDLVNEFKDWGVVGNKSMSEVFRETMTASLELKKMYSYFRSIIAKAYDTGIRTNCIQISHAVECTKCNVDVIVDLFRKALIKRGMEFENGQNEDSSPILYPTEENLERYGKTQLDVEIEVPKSLQETVNERQVLTQNPVVNTQVIESQPSLQVQLPVINDEVVQKDEEVLDDSTVDDSILDELNESPVLSTQQVEENVTQLEEKVRHEISFHDRLANAIQRLPQGLHHRQNFNKLALLMLGARGNENIKTKRIIGLYNELDEYVGAKVLDVKNPVNYTWLERQTMNSPFAWVREKARKRLQRLRVINQDRQWVIVALNLQAEVAAELVKRMRTFKRPKLMRKYFNAKRDLVRLALALR